MKAVMISSIKGGTGKSLIAINLALKLKEYGKVGFLDADIDSSYFAEFTKYEGKLKYTQEVIEPATWNDIKVFSMSLLLGKEKSISVHGDSMRQIIRETKDRVSWGDLDYLVIDMPPSASDVFKSILEFYARELVGGAIVMIPFAELAARRLIELYGYYDVPILGIIENMAYYREGDKEVEVFGPRVGRKLAEEYGMEFLGEIPLDPRISQNILSGSPLIPEDIAEPISRLAEKVVSAKEGSFYEIFKFRLKEYIRGYIDKIVLSLLLSINREFDIKAIREKYHFPGGRPIMLMISDSLDRPITTVMLKLKEDKVVVLKKPVEPYFVIEMPASTLAAIVLGYKKVNKKVIKPFTVTDAWRLGELRVYGSGSIPMMLYVTETLFKSEVLEEARSKYANILAKLM